MMLLAGVAALGLGFAGISTASAAPMSEGAFVGQTAHYSAPVEKAWCRVHRWCRYGRCWVRRRCW
ncbi:MAG TPA: hypothetical protein VKV77_04290 [Methylovirgula sp.]|nr:hypothetical protein [Methylovirgula sp.]